MDPMTLHDIALTLAAAFLGGALNAVAGGGSFLTLPALVAVGVPPVMANATGTLALLPGYIASAWGFRHEIVKAKRLFSPWVIVGASVVGGGVGATLLLLTDDAVFSDIVPWLLLLATLIFAIGDRLLAMLRGKGGSQAVSGKLTSSLVLTGVCIYGGYFNGGLGIILLAAFGLLGVADINAANGLKNLVSALLTIIAVAFYAGGGVVDWPYAGIMAVAAIIGGYAGAVVALKIPRPAMRLFIVAVGAVMTVIFFMR